MEEQRQALEVHKALLQKLERKVAELSQVSSSEERASAGKQTLEVQNGPVPERSLAANAPSQVQASLTEPPKESVPEKEPQKEPRPASSTSAQNLKVYWKEGLRLDSADKSQRLRIGGRIMNDWGFFSTSDQLNDAVGPVVNGTEFRRARLYLSGRMYDRVNFKAQYDFAGGNAGFKDVYIGIDKLPGAGKLQVGHFKEPFSLEIQTSSKYITFMERSLANVFAPERNSGMMIANTGFDKRLTWALGAFRDSDSFGEASGPGNYAVTGRVTTSPWSADGGSKLLHLGLAYSHRNPTGDTLRIRQRPETHLTTSVVPLTVLDNGVGFGGALDFGEDILCRSCPDKGLGRLVARFQVLVDGGLEFGNTAEYAAADALLCQLAEPALDEIEPRRRRGNEVKVEAGVLREPLLHLLMLMRGVVVHDQMQLQRRWRFAIDLA